ncbi:probable glycosyltransferase At3g07620 [Chenopodium quinoa]|uniref:probable glycosyltransferase At3g07620 n=1 Tax=Chenopodium quinoa TaxID=63459 RepID=UPI000B779AE3|nr:probable glycosyltransferase At3g07620 [Chenopodium quinoa]
MSSFYTKHLHIFISILAILSLVAIIFQSKSSNSFSNFFYFAPSSWFWPTTNTNSTQNNIVIHHGVTSSLSFDSLVHSLAVIHNSSTLSKSEEKRQRTMKKLRDEIDKVLIGRKKDEKVENMEEDLTRARILIKQAFESNTSNIISLEDDDVQPHVNIYKNAFSFKRSYLLMEKMFKIYIYEEGEPPLFHHGPCKGIYSMEGIFMNLIEKSNQFRTNDQDEAHVYFLPFSVVMILEHLFDPIVRDKAVLERTILDYVDIISHKYPFWNRSLGADHFMLSCHDWGPRATWYHPILYFHSIRALCNANTSENFNPRKDASIPEINLASSEFVGLNRGTPPSNRTILAFFAGRMHGHIRPALLTHWKGKDEDLQVYEELPKELSYKEMMKRSKFCLCPSGFEVASPRIVEAIYAECVPVLISQSYILPFSDVLDWSTFSVHVSVSEIPNLKKILMDIPYEKYLQMLEGVRQVQRHFVMNDPPKRFDVFHMIIHSIWLRRLNVRIHS